MEKFNTYGQFCNGPSASTSHWGMEIECLAKLGKLKIGEVCYGPTVHLYFFWQTFQIPQLGDIPRWRCPIEEAGNGRCVAQ